ncbi:MAG: VWA domain-containing protein [Chitinophagales bacterium]
MKANKYFIFLLLLLCTIPLVGNDGSSYIKVNEIEVDKENKLLDVYLNIVVGGNGVEEQMVRDNLHIYDEEWTKIEPHTIKSSLGDGATAPVYVLFLLDRSGSMRGEKLSKAKSAIKKTLELPNIPATTYFATFDDNISSNKQLTISNFEDVVGSQQTQSDYDTDLHYAVINKVERLKDKSGKKVIILLTDGKNDIINSKGKIMVPRYEDESVPRYNQEDVYRAVSPLGSDFSIFTIGLGNDVDASFLEKIPKYTSNIDDEYQFAASPDKLANAFQQVAKSIGHNYLVKLRPPNAVFRGEPRELKLEFKDNAESFTDLKEYSFGSTTQAVSLVPTTDSSKLPIFIGGLLFIIGLLLLLSIMIPILRKNQFNKKYVKKYLNVKNPKVKSSDPITMLPFEDEDYVVTKCSHLISLDSWEANNNSCCYYPSQCKDGVAPNDKANFFTQQGINRLLNWLWFGSLGGFIGWCIFLIFDSIDLGFYQDFLQSVFDKDDKQFSGSIFIQTLSGTALGIGLSLALSAVEESGQGGTFRPSKVVLRTLIGGFIAFIIFLAESFLFVNYFSAIPFIGRLFSWILFGTALGYVITIHSSIEKQQGIKGGFIAALIAYPFYFILTQININPEIGKLLGFIIYGGILGGLIHTVVSKLESFYLEYLSPASFRGQKVPISKWLKACLSIYIGQDVDCHVRIKWPDGYVIGKHALLTFNEQKAKVVISPLGETLINNVVIKRERELNDGDIIQLSMNSKTTLQYLEKKEQVNDASILNEKKHQGAQLIHSSNSKRIRITKQH